MHVLLSNKKEDEGEGVMLQNKIKVLAYFFICRNNILLRHIVFAKDYYITQFLLFFDYYLYSFPTNSTTFAMTTPVVTV